MPACVCGANRVVKRERERGRREGRKKEERVNMPTIRGDKEKKYFKGWKRIGRKKEDEDGK